MQAFNVADLINQTVEEKQRYMEFLRVPSMSMGLYLLHAKEQDPQIPHKQDEVYYVLSGKANLQVGEELHAAIPGSILYVEAGAEHQFINIEEFLEVLVFFSPAEQP